LGDRSVEQIALQGNGQINLDERSDDPELGGVLPREEEDDLEGKTNHAVAFYA
jgi:hypothetical protein